MKTASLTMAAALAAWVAAAPAARADPVIVPGWSPFSFASDFFGGRYFGGGGDGTNAFPWTTPGPYVSPSVGCYFTRARVDNAWRQVEVCY